MMSKVKKKKKYKTKKITMLKNESLLYNRRIDMERLIRRRSEICATILLRM